MDFRIADTFTDSLARLTGDDFLPRGRPALSYHENPERWLLGEGEVILRAASRGQEFVLDLDLYPEVTDWLSSVLDDNDATRPGVPLDPQ